VHTIGHEFIVAKNSSDVGLTSIIAYDSVVHMTLGHL